ncbi:hypothetical protein D3C72_1675450 [compost metagenome]
MSGCSASPPSSWADGRTRPGRIRRPPTPAALAGKCPHRAAVRAQRRGRCGVVHPQWRCPVRSLSPRAAGPAATSGRARPERRGHVRIRLAGRRVAHPRPVRCARPAADRLRRRPGPGARPRDRPGARQRRPRGRRTRLPLARLPRHPGRRRAPPYPPDPGGDRARLRQAAGGLVHRPRQPEHPAPAGRGRRAALRLGRLQR